MANAPVTELGNLNRNLWIFTCRLPFIKIMDQTIILIDSVNYDVKRNHNFLGKELEVECS